MNEALTRNGEIEDHGGAEDDPVPAEDGEIMLFDIAHEEFDGKDRHDERGNEPRKQDHKFLRSEIKAEFHKLERARAEHDGNSEEERIFRSHRPGNADQQRAEDRSAAS